MLDIAKKKDRSAVMAEIVVPAGVKKGKIAVVQGSLRRTTCSIVNSEVSVPVEVKVARKSKRGSAMIAEVVSTEGKKEKLSAVKEPPRRSIHSSTIDEVSVPAEDEMASKRRKVEGAAVTEMGQTVGKPDVRCFAAAVTMVLRSTDLGFGQRVHALVLKMVDGGDHLELGGPLMQFYITRCSQRFSDEADVIFACCKDDAFEGAFYVFREIVKAGGSKKSSTISSLFATCAKMEGEGPDARQVHGCAIKVGVESDRFVASSLVGMYGKCGLLKDAMRVFEEIELSVFWLIFNS